MARVGIVFGLILCGLTFAGLVGTELKMPTQFYPMMLGIPVLFCGVVALNPHRRKHAMHVTAGLALLGTVAGTMGSVRWLTKDGTADRYALLITAAMAVICLCLLGTCIASFRAARRRKLGEA
ncbi:MAG: hypothetical protein AAGG48_19025 [Planctomycetota bacterium]